MWDWLKEKHKKGIIITSIVLAALYILFLLFILNGSLPTGADLNKSDWLDFIGSYLSFAGTIAVSLVALAQASYYNEMENNRRIRERLKEIQPLFSVEIVTIDKQPPGTVETFSPSRSKWISKHRNIQLAIRIANDKPARNVCVFEEFVLPLLKPDEKLNLCICFEDSPDSECKSVLKILHSEYKADNEGLPDWFNIEYDDIDGHMMVQTFELNSSFQKKFYSLKEEPWEVCLEKK